LHLVEDIPSPPQWSAGGFSGCLNLTLPKACHAEPVADHARFFQRCGWGPDASFLVMRLELLALFLHLDGVDELLVANLMANDNQSHALKAERMGSMIAIVVISFSNV
jgi:hypothetical protein